MLKTFHDDGRGVHDMRVLAPNLSLKLGQVLAQFTSAQNNQQTLTGGTGFTGGTYDLIILGQRIKNIAFNATAATIQALVVALLAIGTGNATVTGGPLNTATPLVFTFLGPFAGTQVPLIQIDTTNLVGTQAFTLAHSQDAHAIGECRDYTASDGVGPAVAVLACDVVTDADGNVFFGTAATSEWAQTERTVPVFNHGTFRAEDLVGMDATALADLNGHILTGSLTKGTLTF